MKILIVEDEIVAANRLIKMIREYNPDWEISGPIRSVKETIAWFNENRDPDLLFLDIQLADGSSFEIFQQVQFECPVIFTTAYDEYAIQAFQVNSVDYILKPLKQKAVVSALKKYERVFVSPVAKDNRAADRIERFLIRIGKHMHIVYSKEIAYAYTHNKITYIVTRNGKKFPHDHSLEKLSSLLDHTEFFRINRQFIINISSVSDMIIYSKARVKLVLDPPCDLETIVSTDRSSVFKRWLTGKNSS